jgi:hypothetical protein
LLKIISWFLRLNAAKTNIIHTHQTRNIVKPEIQIYDQIVETCKEAKLLGVYLTDTMNWSRQCDHVVNNLRSVCFLFTKLRRRVSASLLRQVYFSYVQSHILYSIVIWGGSPQSWESVRCPEKNYSCYSGCPLSLEPGANWFMPTFVSTI